MNVSATLTYFPCGPDDFTVVVTVNGEGPNIFSFAVSIMTSQDAFGATPFLLYDIKSDVKERVFVRGLAN